MHQPSDEVAVTAMPVAGRPRTRYARPVAVVPLADLRGPAAGYVGPLPSHVYWSGHEPQARRWDLADPAQREHLYAIVLREGTASDVAALLHAGHLASLWSTIYLPDYVRDAWAAYLPRSAPGVTAATVPVGSR